MRKIILFIFAVSTAIMLQAQNPLLLEECFEYDAYRPLISDTVTGSDNYDGVTGWSTQSNKNSGKTIFSITDGPLTYLGYEGSDLGNALQCIPANMSAQSVFKNWERGVVNDSTIYVAFMIRFLKDTQSYANPDYFFAIRMEAPANSTNFAGRMYAMVEQDYVNEEITIGINKASNGTTVYVDSKSGPFLTFDSTYLFVYRYHVGVINGKTAAEEVGHYDDEIWLYINPSLAAEPDKADIYVNDPVAKDAYRLSSSGKEMGGLRGLYLRGGEPGKKSNINPYVIDGFRVGYSWQDVIGKGDPTGWDDCAAQQQASMVCLKGHVYIFKDGQYINLLGTQKQP